MAIFPYLAEAPVSVIVTAALITALVVVFLWKFLAPGLAHYSRLAKFEAAVADPSDGGTVERAATFARLFSADPHLAHLWHEYAESLHKVKKERDGVLRIVEYRATAPAEMYFHGPAVIDGRLHTEFFKHLPGIFTGIGIIGTFTGLIQGLRVFEVSENAATVRVSLETLMHAVGEAFTISAIAIGFAMAVTFMEKLLLAALYRRLDAIVLAIDASFEAGVGEEYLARLVDASEESASQSRIMKDALVQELSELLRELTHAQITAAREHHSQAVEAAGQNNLALGHTIANSIKQSLEAPMRDIAATVKTASGDQSATAVQMLHDVMSSFSERLNRLFGDQISGLSSLNQQAATGMQDAVGTLQQLVANIEQASRRSGDAMAERMADAIDKLEARQAAMNDQGTQFIEQIRELVASSQSETSHQLQATLRTLGEEMGRALGALGEAQRQVFDSNAAREQSMADRASQAVGTMSQSVEAVVMEVNAATAQLSKHVALLAQVTTASVDKMHAGAEKLGAASQNFASAGDRVAGVMGQVAGVSANLSDTSGALAGGSAVLQTVLRDYQAQREAVVSLVAELRATVEAARREAALTNDVLARIEGAAQKLAVAQRQADEYLDGVSQVLGEAHESFATEVKRTLGTANSEFHTKLTTAVGMLSASVEDLDVTLQTLGANERKRA